MLRMAMVIYVEIEETHDIEFRVFIALFIQFFVISCFRSLSIFFSKSRVMSSQLCAISVFVRSVDVNDHRREHRNKNQDRLFSE